jgi:hypothetical protein
MKKNHVVENEKVEVRRGKNVRLVKKGNRKMEMFINPRCFKRKIFG